MTATIQITTANKSKLIATTGFGAYDYCINPYVGCQFGCKYCYVRFFVKDKNKEWGDFVRARTHIDDKLPKEIPIVAGKRLVIGTMTDPYQPAEKKYKLTKLILETIDKAPLKPSEIGIFTRSPMILRDIDLLVKLNVRVHVTITPFSPEVLRLIEPIPIRTESRFKVVETLAKAGVRTHISVSPVLPVYSDDFVTQFADRIAKTGTTGFTVDPMQAYGESFDATSAALAGDVQWPSVARVIKDRDHYREWKVQNMAAWTHAWRGHSGLNILPMVMDHASKTRVDVRTGDSVSFRDFTY